MDVLIYCYKHAWMNNKKQTQRPPNPAHLEAQPILFSTPDINDGFGGGGGLQQQTSTTVLEVDAVFNINDGFRGAGGLLLRAANGNQEVMYQMSKTARGIPIAQVTLHKCQSIVV